jgi:hypothetical protein
MRCHENGNPDVIRYNLKCVTGHGFESWFQGADAFAVLKASGQLACPVCGIAEVEKELMAPAVRPARAAPRPGPGFPTPRPRRNGRTFPTRPRNWK